MSLSKDNVTRVPVWVKLHKVPVVAYSEDGLSLIATQIGNLIMLDAFTSLMCVEEQGQIGYARALIEVRADKELKQEVIMAVPNVEDDSVSHTLEKIRVEYEWKPPLCLDYHMFGHANKQCPKRVQEQPSHTVEADDDGFTHVPVKTATKDHKPGVTKATNKEQDNGIKLKNLFEKLNEITVPLTCESSGENDMEDILGVNIKANHDEVLGTGDPVHVKTTYLNKAAKADLEDVLNDDDEEVDETYIEVNNRLIKQTKGASTPSNQRMCSKVFKQWQWTSNGLMCSKGSRIILGWNPNIVNVVVVSFDAQVMHVCVYFKADKKELPWCISEDFNVSLNADEKSTGSSYIDTAKSNLRSFPTVLRIPMESNSKPRPFKFSNILVCNTHFKDTVANGWKVTVSGFWMFKVVKRLKMLKKLIRKLLYDHGNVHKNVNKLPHELDKKAKVEWLKLGDANTAYFHKVVKIQATRNHIDCVTTTNGVNVDGDQLSSDVANHMIRDVSDQEIHEAMFVMGDNKAPGPDGYIAVFFKEAWDILATDVTKAIKEFFTNGVLLKELNHTILALIPKVTSPMKIIDYRPISCCNILYKCISMIISNRMKDCLMDLVSLNQSAFVPGRRISDNILLTQELMHNYHLDRGTPRCMFKVDIQKAYDTLGCNFLHAMLIGFGFHPRIIGWIMECVTSTSFSLGINGTLHGYFKGKRGSRQGDLMSPYLFTLVIEVLTLMLHRRARVSGSFTYHRHCSKLNLINLYFADDLFLFAHGEVDSARVIMNMLVEFKEASGLTPSLPKITAYFCNVLNHTKLDILNILPFKEVRATYAGFSLVSRRDEDESNGFIPISSMAALFGRFLFGERCHGDGEKFSSWPDAWMSKYSNLGPIEVPHLTNTNDTLVWKDLSNVDVGFSVWEQLKRFTSIPNILSSLDAIVDFLSSLAKMSSARSVISKLMFAASYSRRRRGFRRCVIFGSCVTPSKWVAAEYGSESVTS
ncbi:hypothetical protein Tco_0008395 [Tanacetum coccineum]